MQKLNFLRTTAVEHVCGFTVTGNMPLKKRDLWWRCGEERGEGRKERVKEEDEERSEVASMVGMCTRGSCIGM